MATENRTPRGPTQYVDLGVGGMTCDECVRTVTRALESVPGVKGAEVSLARRSARVAVEPSIESDRLTAAVRASGYHGFVRSQRTDA